jgi:hypothetical protein
MWNNSVKSGKCLALRVFAENGRIPRPQIRDLAKQGWKTGKAWDPIEGMDAIEDLNAELEAPVDGVQSDSWIVRFRGEIDALSFGKTWYRKPLSYLAKDRMKVSLLLQVDPL